jgi:hypothetical protein
MTSTLWAQRGSEGTGIFHSEDAAQEAFGYWKPLERKCFRNKRRAEAWIDEVAQRPSKRPRVAYDVTRIVCDGVATPDGVGAVGVYFGLGDSRNASAQVSGWRDWESNMRECDRFWTEVCAIYVAIKRAPHEGKVVIESPCRFAVSYVDSITLGRKSNWYVDSMIMSIKDLLLKSNRRIVLAFIPRIKSKTVQHATDLAFDALTPNALHAQFPLFPLAEDVVTPWIDSHFD